MKLLSKFLIAILLAAALLCYASPRKQAIARKPKLHDATDWRIQPSFTLDTVCLLNVLTGDAFCGGLGTAGMLMGVSRALREAGCAARIIALEPSSSPAITQGKGGAHRVDGIATGSVPPHLEQKNYDEARAVDEGAARVMARRLAKEEGIFCGTSSGLNVTAALQLAAELGTGHCVATVAVDTGLKYLAGDLFSDD
jgi:cysteine synthase A